MIISSGNFYEKALLLQRDIGHFGMLSVLSFIIITEIWVKVREKKWEYVTFCKTLLI